MAVRKDFQFAGDKSRMAGSAVVTVPFGTGVRRLVPVADPDSSPRLQPSCPGDYWGASISITDPL